ncbi:hypothetical protein KM043_000897 [Ampulex compressa]|nr:hypothetical protein KM043_000897 [Ampulex compressa]
MCSRMKLLVLLALGLTTLAQGEIVKDPTLCARTRCKVPAQRKFKYEEGVAYRYKYAVDVTTNLGARNSYVRNESTLNIDAMVSVRFGSPCEGVLRFHNASISHDRATYNPEFPNRAGAEFRLNLERFSLRFAFDDGQIREVCPNRRDPAWAVNLKRGALSMLQNTMKRFDIDHRGEELDVNGICDTRYRLHEAKRTSLIIRKTKDLADCMHGSKHLSVIQSNVYRSPRSTSRRPRQPLLKSRGECEISIDHNVYERVVCNEVHLLQPLSSGDVAGPRTESTASLLLVKEDRDGYYHGYEEEEEEEEEEDEEEDEEQEEEEGQEEEVEAERRREREKAEENWRGKGNDKDKRSRVLEGTKRTNLLYDFSKTSKTMHGELRTSRDLLKGMCRLGTSTDEMQQSFSETFTSFVQSSRHLDYPSLSQLFARANSICRSGKKHMINALPFLGSNAAVNVMRDLITKKYVDRSTIDHWVTAFALIPRPTRETIEILSPLLDFQDQIPEAQFVLSYSAVIHAYCSNNDVDCLDIDRIDGFLSHLELRIREGCAPRSRSIFTNKRTIEALKAVGNMGLERTSLRRELKGCIDDVGGFIDMEVRLAAVEAHRRFESCQYTRDQFFLDYYRNYTLDSEVRIASYLQVMRCPDYNVIKTIKHTLGEEEVNQVGSFVWSHLTNLYKSSSPTRIEIQSLLTDRDLGPKFNSDVRKFSRNYEGSFFSEDYNFGANYQSNVIFSPKSYVPRTLDFNFTVDLFGESVNAIEIKSRMEGMEYYVENFFGPEGPYSNEKVSHRLKSLLRNFRAAPESEDYWKRVKRIPNVIDNNFENPRVSFGYRIFGNELKYAVFNGDEEIRRAVADWNPWEKVKRIFSGKEIHYENAAMFLDSTYVVPTTSGLPVRLDLSGSAACNFKISGLLDIKRSFGEEIQLIGNIMPSVSLDVVGSMTIDAFYKSAGLKLRSNVYSSGGVQVELEVKAPRLVRLSLGLPNKRTEILSAHTDILLIRGNGAEIEERPLGASMAISGPKESKRPIVPGSVISNTTCTWTALDRLIGLKLCTDYQFPNVTKNADAPYFPLSGPTLLRVSLYKADPTARNYLLEYKWERTEEQSIFRVAFDTPGSRVNRELSAMVSFDVKTQNVTLLLRSAGNSVIAKGTYKSTENETSIDIGFDINGTKHLDASVGYSTKRFNHGYAYSPTMHLTINNERVAALLGTIRNAQKNNVSQCDIDLTFRTKKVWSRLVGYIVRRNVSLAGDFQLEYQLQKMPKKETLHLEISLTNRSSKTLTHKSGDLKLHSSAYPQLNTVITAWYQQALGHLELHAEVNSSPHLRDDRHKLTAQLVVSYSKVYFQNQGTKVSALIAVTKPIQNLDIKVGVNHYAVGVESKTNLLIGYAPGKEITLAVNTIMPRGIMFSVEGHANLTIPNFKSLLIDARITERSRGEYELDFAGTWFSGHNMTARGTYSDKSVGSGLSHNLKLILKSPSFGNDVLLNCKVHKNYSDVRISLCVEQLDMDKYAFVLNHTVISPTRFLTYVEGRYKSYVYSAMTNVDAHREIRMEMHLDKWRDVHLALIGINEAARKEFGVELKWDANRDPALKLATLFQLYKHRAPATTQLYSPGNNVSAIVTLTYPGRFISGSWHLAVREPYRYTTDVTVKWNPERTIKASIDVDYDVRQTTKSLKLESQLLTPFENWRKTALDARYQRGGSKIVLSTSVHWRDSQHVMAEFYGNSDRQEGIGEWVANCGLTSTVHSISWVTVNVTHKLIRARTADTRLLLKYSPDKTLDAWSIWHLDKESDTVFNLTGNLHLESPFASYRRNDLRCQLSIMPDWKFFGAANLDLDKRKYAGNLVGDLLRIKESMVRFNVTTPLEKYSFVRGRFGLSESDRHIVAEIVSPGGPLGFEVLLRFFTPSEDFNVKLLLATPVEILRRALLVAKLNKREANFRIAYNDMLAGFQGVWHYNNITDFHYSYMLFTPLSGFEENGVVTKLIAVRTEPEGRMDVDAEFSISLAELKIGGRAKAGPKAPPVKIPIKTPIGVPSESREKIEEIDTSLDEDAEDTEETFYWAGEMEIWPGFMETLIGDLDIEKEDLDYKILCGLRLPQGKIVLQDHFSMEDLFNMRNELTLETPFRGAREIASHYALAIDLENSVYAFEVDLNVQRNSTWIESGLHANYTYLESESDDSRTHTLRVIVKTPLDFLRYLNTRTILDIDENLYKSTLTIRTRECAVNLHGALELEQAYVDTLLSAEIDTPSLKIASIKLTAKKDFTDKERYLGFSANASEPISRFASFQSTWQLEDNYGKASIGLQTSLNILKSLEADLLYDNSIAANDSARLSVDLRYPEGQRYKLTGEYEGGSVKGQLFTPLYSADPHFEFHGESKKIEDELYNVEGELVNLATGEVRKTSSVITTRNDALSALETTIQPTKAEGGHRAVIRFKMEKYGFHAALDSRPLNGSVATNLINAYNWDVRARLDGRNETGGARHYRLSTFMNVQINGNTTIYVHGETPFEELQSLTLTGNMLLSNKTGNARLNHRLNQDLYYTSLQWKLLYMVDMSARLMAGYQTIDLGGKDLDARVFFANPRRAYRNVAAGFDVDVDNEAWKFAANATVGFHDHENVDAVLAVRLPPPDNDDHRFLASYHAKEGLQDMSYVIGYNAVRGEKNYASDGSIRMVTRDINGHLRLTWGMSPSQWLNNLFNVSFDDKDIRLKYSLYTPKHPQEETAVVLFHYDAGSQIHCLIDADVFYPASKKVGAARISYQSLANVNGTLNTSLALTNFTEVGCNFIVLTTLKQNKRLVEFFWPNNTALLNSDYSYHSEKLDSSLEGVLHLEVPLSTRHVGHVAYGYKKRPQVTTGRALVRYNGREMVHGRYNSKSESRAGLEKDRIEITVENIYKPLGIVYVNRYEYSAGNEGTNYPTVEHKQLNIYRLDNRTALDVSGESRVKTSHAGQDIYLKAIHSNRTVQLKADYRILPGEFDQNAWLGLADDAWISYRVNILNKTTEDVDNQFLVFDLAYPRRNFTLDASYRITKDELVSDAKLEWDRRSDRPRTVGAAFNWTNLGTSRMLLQQRAALLLKHPSFEKEVSLKGEVLKRDSRDILNVALTVDYSTNSDKLLRLSALLRDDSVLPDHRRYSYNVSGEHPSTKLDLDLSGFVHKHKNVLLHSANTGSYKRAFLPEESGELVGRVDLTVEELLFRRRYNDDVKHLELRYYHPASEYVVNGSIVNTPNLNASGALFFDRSEKLTWLMVNYTPDALESLRMYGRIPDARNAVFDIWRTYDRDFSVSDVSFYLKLNHSRLVTSTLRWRPELRSDVTDFIKDTIHEAYEGMSNDVNYWKQYVKGEAANVISDVWDDAQEELAEFLDDWKDLRELETDFEDLRVYLNDSYNANDFYIKDIVGFGVYVIDELSLRSHIESLPSILNEIWEIMGESGEAIRNSLLWVIKAIKDACNKLSEVVAAVLRGDSVSQIVHFVSIIIDQYDMLIKDLHVSFIKYMENLWNKASISISEQWHKFLRLIEPLFIRLLHYLEAVAWKASKEVLDFLYDRRNDIVASPYFDRFANFTQDVDKFYRDIKSNDIITNIHKYSGVVIEFLKERYVTFVPFGAELKAVVDEILSELKELQKLPSVHYALEKTQQLYDRAIYVYEYLEIRAKIENIIRLVHSKLMDVSQTALEAESRYREAKTKFIFDPHRGLMCLEQKLPMSWHAFNQTPEFHEIPEFRAIADMKSYFVTSNMTFWSIYYQYKPYTETTNWLPPFRAQAMIVGSQHYTTFDGRHFDFAGPCTYLLARDFVRDTFSVLAKYDTDSERITHKIIVLVGESAIELDIFDKTIKSIFNGSARTATDLQLPVELDNGTVYVHQKYNVVTVERVNGQFRLECNLKFSLCTLELSGWYYGKTAGILGTMNNEQMDDAVGPNGIIESEIGTFARGWSIDGDEGCAESSNLAIATKHEDSVVSVFCEQLFVNGSSEFGSCFAVVDPGNYYSMCLTSFGESEACTVAISYMQFCTFHDIYLRIPDMCTTCGMMDGSQVAEGQFKKLEGETVPRSADIVFIVEAKECNRGLRGNSSIELLIVQLNKEFRDQGLAGNRWSLVLFGGNGVFDRPRSVILEGQIFTKNVSRFVDYFDYVPVGEGNRDVFAAIGFASQLTFRAGVSKTFLLMPCSNCEPENQTLDYSVLHQVLLEHDITLHILMDGEFEFKKERLNKIFYGLDATTSYTKKDARTFGGDTDLRRQVRLSKTALGYCTPLSLETNGTIFSSDRLRYDKLASIKKFASVFSKRVALTARPSACQHCECTADNDGVTQMECMPCVYPTPVMVDYEGFNMNDTFVSLQSTNVDYGQIDVEDD